MHFSSQKNKYIKEQLYSQKLELGITLASLSKNVRFNHYLTKPKSMLEWKLLAKLGKNPEVVHSFDYRRCSHPLYREFLIFT